MLLGVVGGIAAYPHAAAGVVMEDGGVPMHHYLADGMQSPRHPPLVEIHPYQPGVLLQMGCVVVWKQQPSLLPPPWQPLRDWMMVCSHVCWYCWKHQMDWLRCLLHHCYQ